MKDRTEYMRKWQASYRNRLSDHRSELADFLQTSSLMKGRFSPAERCGIYKADALTQYRESLADIRLKRTV